MELNETLRENRKRKQLTQQQLADKLFVSNKTISNWETGKTLPDIESLIRLANVFNLSLNDLLLEGSDMVENVKLHAQKQQFKKYNISSLITSIVLITILIKGNLSTPLTLLAVIGVYSNLGVMSYFIFELITMKSFSKTHSALAVLFIVYVAIFGAVTILYVPHFLGKLFL